MDHWEGYRGSGPVRIGNAAVSQFQGDIYGELMDALYLSNKYVSPTSYDVWVKIRKRLEWICENWQLPDAGIWEMRNRQEHFVYSKVMNSVALDRGIRLADKRALPADRAKWMRERDRIYEEVMTQGWNDKRKAFTQFYGSEDLDASLLIMPLVFFMAPTDPRMLSTRGLGQLVGGTHTVRHHSNERLKIFRPACSQPTPTACLSSTRVFKTHFGMSPTCCRKGQLREAA